MKAAREKGQSLAVIVILLPLIVICLGVTVDLGWAYREKGSLQSAADAAALAGALVLRQAEPFSSVEQMAKDYAFRDGAEDCQVTVESETVTVQVSREVKTIFAGFFGVNYLNLKAEASAKVKYALLAETPIPTFGPTPTLILTPTPTSTPAVKLCQ